MTFHQKYINFYDSGAIITVCTWFVRVFVNLFLCQCCDQLITLKGTVA
jgi:hypothetical protein